MSTSKPIALITGANKGIGFTLARTLARDHGFHILLSARNAEAGAKATKELQDEGLSVEFIAIDVSDDSSIEAAVRFVKEKHGHIDVLVNNAGISIDYKHPGPLRAMYQATYNTNVFGTVCMIEAFAPLLEKSTHPPPRIVSMSSMLGSIADRNDPKSVYDPVECNAYRVSKSSINMVTAIYARKFRDQGWKVNSICPGYVRTAINDGDGMMSTEEAMPNLVRVCTLGPDGPTATFTDPSGTAPF